MKDKKNLTKIIVIIAIIIFISIIYIPKSLAVRPSDMTGSAGLSVTIYEAKNKIIDMLTKIGAYTSVGVMMILGIKYMIGSTEQRAEYKKTMLPYVIGCILIFGASTITLKIFAMAKKMNTIDTAGNLILGIIQVVGSFVSVGVLMILGIKYMVGTIEQRAEYKKTMLPYIIGAILLFGALNITATVVDVSKNMTGGSRTAAAVGEEKLLLHAHCVEEQCQEELVEHTDVQTQVTVE